MASTQVAAPETIEARELLSVLLALKKGDFSVRMPVDRTGMPGKVYDALNDVIDLNARLSRELTRVSTVVGKEGKTTQRASLGGATGGWAECVDAVNTLVVDLLQPTTEVARVIGAVAKGDLSQTMALEIDGRPLTGEFLRMARTVNTMVDQLGAFASEVTRVAREVGTEGKLGGQAEVKGVAGTWKDLTDSVNVMASNLTSQVRNIADVTTAVANGDLSRKITVDVRGEILELKNTINTMVDQLNSFASEVTRVARDVGTEGKLGGQAEVRDVSGTWKDLTESVNLMANNLTSQVRNIAEVATAVAKGDLSKKITVDVRGEILELKDTINTMVDQLGAFASEVTRVAREVGTEGKLGGQADVKGVAGTWKDLTDSVNVMASNLTSQVRNIADVTTAVANGDLSKKITVDVRGEILELKNTINTMVDQLNAFASEVSRVAREVGTEGQLGGQANVRGVSGIWEDLTDSVNSMANNLTSQVRNIAAVTTAVANGDLSKKITVDVSGEILELKNTINTMVDQLGAFASEVTRVAREVGTEGKLGGQAEVKGVSGTWKDLTDNVNLMANNLTSQVRNIADVTTAVANGDLSKKITVDVRGEILELKNTINTMVDQLNSFASEVTRVARDVGTEGKLGGQAYVAGVGGVWKDLTDNVNFMASNLTSQVRNIAAVTTAVATGDLSKTITVDAKGEIQDLKSTINTMVDQLNSFASEVTRVAREVGTEGKLGGQAEVKGVAGTWKDLTDNVNLMADNLTSQVRGIARVVTAVANGNLKQRFGLEAKGEIADLADTINSMIDTLATFADQVTGVAREVGIDGKLGGQANVPGAAGTWRDLTDNVNQLARTLTTQIRAISDVATAVTAGDLSRSITVDAAGEVAALKDNINQMIRNLRDTTRINTEQDWLKTNVARYTRMLQGQRDLLTVSRMILSELAPLVSVQHGVFYLNDSSGSEPVLKLLASYGYQERRNLGNRFHLGEGLVGQCFLERQRILLTEVPHDYVKINSGLGDASPHNIVVLPVLFEGEVLAVIELASFNRFSETHLMFLDQLAESIGIVLNTLQASMRTEELLKQSQSLTQELQNQQQELQETNRRLEQQAQSLQASEERLREQQEELQTANGALQEKARELVEQNSEVELKNRQIELARQELEEKAQQLAISSRYKSEFLANMSHELRTPLNSMLLLSRLLADNAEGSLNLKQVEYASTIHSSGNDLLSLINEILDLAKIEAGKMELQMTEVPLGMLRDYVDRNFRELAQEKGLEFRIELAPDLPECLRTDSLRLQQVLRNLLSNAIKFTDQGSVVLQITRAAGGFSSDHPILGRAASVLAFAVRDTGIGIAADRHQLVFEAFQQGDGTTSRRYGGTGLGLSISREMASLLGGEIRLQSRPLEGSTFTLYLPELAPLVTPGSRLAAPGEAGLHLSPSLAGPALFGRELRAGSRELERSEVADDRETAEPEDRVLLIAEDDATFARVLLDRAHRNGFKGIVTREGGEVLALARRFRPVAITLDIGLPDTDGWKVLDRLKHDSETRHIPVHVISAADERRRSLKQGAIAHLCKPVTPAALDGALAALREYAERPVKRLLLIAEDAAEREQLTGLMGGRGVETLAVANASEAIALLAAEPIDCLVLADSCAQAVDAELAARLRTEENGGGADPRWSAAVSELPVILYQTNSDSGERSLTGSGESALDRRAESFLVANVRSPEQLLDQTTRILHQAHADLSEPQRQMLEAAWRSDPKLADRRILIVDDDVRNIFALTSLLERHGVVVSYAESGQEAIAALQRSADVDLVLMDVMMPGMDGYETMRRIREEPEFRLLPIIALTAKAMQGDREKCLEAGASDYIAKPVDAEQLLSLLRVWVGE